MTFFLFAYILFGDSWDISLHEPRQSKKRHSSLEHVPISGQHFIT